jgi:hypothetical protein
VTCHGHGVCSSRFTLLYHGHRAFGRLCSSTDGPPGGRGGGGGCCWQLGPFSRGGDSDQNGAVQCVHGPAFPIYLTGCSGVHGYILRNRVLRFRLLRILVLRFRVLKSGFPPTAEKQLRSRRLSPSYRQRAGTRAAGASQAAVGSGPHQ